MLRIEQRNAATPVERKPEWIKAKVQMGPEFVQLKNLVKKEGLPAARTSSSAGKTRKPPS